MDITWIVMGPCRNLLRDDHFDLFSDCRQQRRRKEVNWQSSVCYIQGIIQNDWNLEMSLALLNYSLVIVLWICSEWCRPTTKHKPSGSLLLPSLFLLQVSKATHPGWDLMNVEGHHVFVSPLLSCNRISSCHDERDINDLWLIAPFL